MGYTAEQRASRLCARQAKRPTVLAEAPVKVPEIYAAPLRVEGLPVMYVAVAAMEAPSSEIYSDTTDRAARIDEKFGHPNKGNDRAALRAQLRAGHEYGPSRSVVAWLADKMGGSYWVVKGSVSAIRQALPDTDTLASWVDAGVLQVPDYQFSNAEAQGSDWTLRSRPIGQALKIHQMEFAGR
jgi:hypothetical protein